MTISEWLDEKDADGVDVTHIVVPDDLTSEEEPEETIFFKDIRTCSVLCTGQHPFATVERFGEWYYSRGREKKRVRTRHGRNGGCTQKTESSPLIPQNHTYNYFFI